MWRRASPYITGISGQSKALARFLGFSVRSLPVPALRRGFGASRSAPGFAAGDKRAEGRKGPMRKMASL